jgi:hypothetical protein
MNKSGLSMKTALHSLTEQDSFSAARCRFLSTAAAGLVTCFIGKRTIVNASAASNYKPSME